jgi:hypothetical protein
MDESTQAAASTETPTAYGWCHWHKANATDIRLVAVQEASGNGRGSYFACPPCREQHYLTPLTDRP